MKFRFNQMQFKSLLVGFRITEKLLTTDRVRGIALVPNIEKYTLLRIALHTLSKSMLVSCSVKVVTRMKFQGNKKETVTFMISLCLTSLVTTGLSVWFHQLKCFFLCFEYLKYFNIFLMQNKNVIPFLHVLIFFFFFFTWP